MSNLEVPERNEPEDLTPDATQSTGTKLGAFAFFARNFAEHQQAIGPFLAIGSLKFFVVQSLFTSFAIPGQLIFPV